MLEKMHISKYEANELATAAERLVRVLKEINGEAYLAEITALVEHDLSDLNRALGRESRSAYTEKIQAQDDRRDRAYRNLRDFCANCASDFDEEIEKAGLLLDGIFEKHGKDLADWGLTRQTGALKLLFTDLDKPGAADALKTIGAKAKYDRLKKEQEAFEQLYREKISEESREDTPLIGESKRELKSDLKHALDVVEKLEELRPAKTKEIIPELNEIIIDVRQIVLARESRQEKGKS